MPECIPYYEPGQQITFHAEAAVTGKRFVNISDPKQGPAGSGLSSTAEGQNIVCSHAAANGDAIGVAVHDVAIGKKGGALCTPGFVVPVTADGAISAGDLIMVGATGKAKTYDPPALSGNAEDLPTAPAIVGVALDDAADAADAMIKLRV